MTAWVRPRTLGVIRIAATCDLTVWIDTVSSCAISALERPRASRRRMCCSRSDNPGSGGFRAARRSGRRHPPVVGAVRQPVLLARVRAHVPGRVHRGRVPRRHPVRLGVAAGPARLVRADGVDGGAVGGRGRRAAAGRHRRLGGPPGGPLPAGQAGGAGRAGPDHPGRAGAPARVVQRPRGGLRHRDPAAAVAAGADLRLDHHRGGAAALDRLRGDAHQPERSPRSGDSGCSGSPGPPGPTDKPPAGCLRMLAVSGCRWPPACSGWRRPGAGTGRWSGCRVLR